MVRKVISPLLAITALSLACSFSGCSCRAQMGTEAAAKAPEPPPPPPPPPAPAPAPAPVVAEAPKPKLVAVGRAKIQDNKVEIPGQLEFDVDKATIRDTPASKEILGTLKDFMKQNPGVTKLRVEGHTDNSGTPERNKVLSQQRADAVSKWLTDNGCEKTRVVAVGHGQDKPVSSNDTAENKQKNRRTEFHVVEMEGKEVGGGAASAPPAATPATPATPANPGNPNEKKPDAVKPATTPATPGKPKVNSSAPIIKKP